MDEDTRIGCGLIVGTIIVVLAIIVIGSVAWWFFYQKPLVDTAFNSQVQGLVSEYCTAPRAPDEEAARIQLKTLVAGKPDSFNQLPSQLKQEAQAVMNNDRRSACI